MNNYFKKKKSGINAYKHVRININLNKNNGIKILRDKFITLENNLWANNWMEQSFEMKSNFDTVEAISFKETRLVKWWEN